MVAKKICVCCQGTWNQFSIEFPVGLKEPAVKLNMSDPHNIFSRELKGKYS